MKRKTSANERFHASGGVFPQTVLWEFGSVSPARTFVSRRCAKPLGRYVQATDSVQADNEAEKLKLYKR